MYVPCKSLVGGMTSVLLTSKSDLANYIYDRPDELALDLQGIFIADRECLSLP